MRQETHNPMQQPRIGKVVVNISVGQSGEQLQKATAVLGRLTGKKPCQRLAKKTVRDWGIRENEPISCVVTLRKEKAIEFLKKSLEVVGNRLPKSSFDVHGNFSFGINEHIEISGVKYDPALGIFGMDVCVAMEKPGYRVKRRRILRAQIGRGHKLTVEEAIEYIQKVLDIEILE